MTPQYKRLIHANNNPEQIALCGSDYIVSHVGIPMILFFSYRIDRRAFESALQQVVENWYVLAGRIRSGSDKRAYIDCDDTGLVFEVFEHSTAMPRPSVEEPLRNGLRKYHPLILPWRVENKAQAPCVVQLHYYKDGTVFSLTCCHSVADGWGMWAIIDAIARNMGKESYDLPNHSRDMLVEIAHGYIGSNGRRPNSPRLADTNRVQKAIFTLRLFQKVAFPKPNEIVHLSAKLISAFKERAPDIKLSRQDIAIGIIAHGMKLESVGALANMRVDPSSPIQQSYSGNALTYRECSMKKEECNAPENSLELSVLRFSKQWRASTLGDSGSDAIEYMAHLEHRLEEGTINKVVPLSMFDVFADGILINNYSVFPIYDVDFGGGTAQWYEMMPFPFRGALITNTPERDGGLLLNLTADQNQLDNVRRVIEKLAFDV